MKKRKWRKWAERTELEEMLISLIQDLGDAWRADNDEEIEKLLEDKVTTLDYVFVMVPWCEPHCANDDIYPLTG